MDSRGAALGGKVAFWVTAGRCSRWEILGGRGPREAENSDWHPRARTERRPQLLARR